MLGWEYLVGKNALKQVMSIKAGAKLGAIMSPMLRRFPLK
jgi:hypothetical protein